MVTRSPAPYGIPVFVVARKWIQKPLIQGPVVHPVAVPTFHPFIDCSLAKYRLFKHNHRGNRLLSHCQEPVFRHGLHLFRSSCVGRRLLDNEPRLLVMKVLQLLPCRGLVGIGDIIPCSTSATDEASTSRRIGSAADGESLMVSAA